jgi:CheY-like chemotaxis protein
MAKTVLLIDYYPRSISRIRSLLQSSGYRTVVAHDADQGMEEFQKATPDLTLIQDLLPKGHGYEVCRQLKDSEHGHRSPVILLTAPRGGGRRHELLQTRCDDFVEKPFTDDALMAAVRKILPVAETAPPVPKAAAAHVATQAAGAMAVAAAAPSAPVPIPVEFTADDIGTALDMIMPGPARKKEEPVEADAKAAEVVEEPSNGKRRSLKSLLKRKRKPRSATKSKSTAKSKSASKGKGDAKSAKTKSAAARKKRKSTKKKAARTGTSGKKVPAPA